MEEKKGEHPLGDAGQLIFLAAFIIVWMTDSFFVRFSTVFSACLPLSMRLGILGLLLIIAVYLFIDGHSVVSHEQRPRTMVSSGAFRYVRHPLYLASILSYLGLTIATASLISLALLVVIVAFYSYIASYEEKLLEARFGEAYNRYKSKTGKWVPRIGRRN
jgi:protein-S-isoprenylcysteine O-methyltransferase Ste14